MKARLGRWIKEENSAISPGRRRRRRRRAVRTVVWNPWLALRVSHADPIRLPLAMQELLLLLKNIL
jgi:hypothetical protein